MSDNKQYGTYPPPEVQMPYGAWQVPTWADPRAQERKKMRRAASSLAWAVVAAVPLSTLLAQSASLFLRFCGVSASAGEGIGGMPSAVYYLLSAFVTFLTLALPFALFLTFGKRPLADSILVEKIGFGNGIVLTLAGLFLCLVMNIPANMLADLIESFGLNGTTNTEGMTVNSTWDIITLFLSVVLVAPVAEEFAFRGVTVAVMRRWGDWPAVLFSAILFAFAHYSFLTLPVVLTGGLVMALLYVWTRNIWVTIFIHFLNNLIAAVPIAVRFYAGDQAAMAVTNLMMTAIFFLGILSIIIISARHFMGRPVISFRMQKGLPTGKKPACLFVNVGFIVYFIMFIARAVESLYAV